MSGSKARYVARNRAICIAVASPGSRLALTPLTQDLAAEVATWFTDDDEGQRRLDASFYGGLRPRWWLLVQGCAGRYGWVGLAGDERVGFLDLEVERGQGSLTIYVCRGFRGRGIGVALLGLAAVEARTMGMAELVGHVEKGYVASIRCLLSAGFSQIGMDAYGPIFSLRLTDS
jgi:GNAT superfamily N-acetyltransferase